jgi:hypothetical protein
VFLSLPSFFQPILLRKSSGDELQSELFSTFLQDIEISKYRQPPGRPFPRFHTGIARDVTVYASVFSVSSLSSRNGRCDAGRRDLIELMHTVEENESRESETGISPVMSRIFASPYIQKLFAGRKSNPC